MNIKTFLIYCTLFLLTFSGTCPTSRVTKLGISGVWPPGATLSATGLQATPEQWTTFWTGVKSNSEVLGVHTPISALPPLLASVTAQGITPVVVTDDPVSDSDVSAQIAMVPSILSQFPSIKVWCVGNEIDNKPDLAGVASRVNRVIAAIESAKSSVITCTTFQLERVRADSAIVSKVKLFSGDALAITSYPEIAGYTNPAALPTTYYTTVESWATQAGKKLIVTEVAWSSTASETTQDAFMKRFLQEIGPKSAAVVNWFSLYDFSSVGTPFNKMGLGRADSTMKPVNSTWKTALQVPYTGSF